MRLSTNGNDAKAEPQPATTVTLKAALAILAAAGARAAKIGVPMNTAPQFRTYVGVHHEA